MDSMGATVSFTGGRCTISLPNGRLLASAERVGNGRLYSLWAAPSAPAVGSALVARASVAPDRVRLWHERFGHVNTVSINRLFERRLVVGVDCDMEAASTRQAAGLPSTHCASCAVTKSRRQPFPDAATERASRPLALLHTDVCGPLPVESRQHAVYFVTVTDDYSRFVWVRPLASKGQAGQAVRDFIFWAETQHSDHGYRVQRVRSDGGGEYMSDEQRNFLTQRGIELQRSTANTPQQNGVAERLNLTLLNLVRAMLHSARLPQYLWADVLYTAAYLRNRSMTRSLAGRTPYEAWHGVKPDISNLRAFGCLAYLHVHPKQRLQGKLGARAVRCALVGYSSQSKAWLLWDPASRTVHDSRDVHFEERLSWYDGAASRPAGRGGALPASAVDTSSSPVDHAAHGDESDDDDGASVVPQPEDDGDSADHIPISQLVGGHHPALPVAAGPTSDPAPSRSVRRQLMDHNAPGPRDNAPSILGSVLGQFDEDQAHVGEDDHDDPSSLRDALSRPDAKEWRAAAQAEYDSLQEAGTYDLVELPRGRTAVGNKWVFKVKQLADGNTKYKARLVAKGFTQQPGIDYRETYAPVVRFASLRALLALAACYNWEVQHMDVRTAYLNGVLDEEIYMRQPEGFEIPGKEHYVCRLWKGLYGLRQAGRAWYQTIHPALQRLGLAALATDYCVYVYHGEQDEKLILGLYVDDLFLFSPSVAVLDRFKEQLRRCFRMEDLGEIKLMLGMHVVRDRAARTLTISQDAYVDKLLARLNAPVNAVSTPMEHGLQLRAAGKDYKADPAGITRYQAAIGALMYAAAGTRPDIAYAVHALSRYSSCPDGTHWAAVKHLLRYLRGTTSCGITYTGADAALPHLTCYGDADYAGCLDDRRSVSGYALTLCGGAISWASRKQRTTALSTVEAEFMAMTDVAKDVVWWRSFLGEIGLDMRQPTEVLCDNMGTLALAANPTHHEKTKHFAVRQQYVRELLDNGDITVAHIASQHNAADNLTKALTKVKHSDCMTILGMALP
jgi:transposase InsO family protein